MGLEMYKTVQTINESSADKNYKIFNSIHLWINDALKSPYLPKQKECLLNAKSLVLTTLEELPNYANNSELKSFQVVLLKINQVLSDCLKNCQKINEFHLKESIDSLVKIKSLYKK